MPKIIGCYPLAVDIICMLQILIANAFACVTRLRAQFCRLSFVITQNSNTYEKQTYNRFIYLSDSTTSDIYLNTKSYRTF